MGKLPKVYLCHGKKCRGGGAEHRRVAAVLKGVANVQIVGCQKICKGPVVGLDLDGQMEWFKELDSDKACTRLVELVREGTLSKPLAKRRLSKRSGCKPRGKKR